MLTPADFRRVELFADQSDDDLAWLAAVAREIVIEAGEQVLQRGDPAREMMVLLDGAFQIFRFNGGQRTLFATLRAGSVSGLLPFSRLETFAGEGFATEPSRMALVHRDHFGEMLTRMPEVGQRLVGMLSDRVREATRGEQQREKLTALGKLSAGLAHELNNPSAAVRRAAASLREKVEAMPRLAARLVGHGLTPAQVEGGRISLASCTAALPGTVGALERGEREDALADWLDAHAVADGYALAETLADAGIAPHDLDHFAEHVPPDALADVVTWIEAGMAANRLLEQIEAAAGRIAALVASVKAYSHMDQAGDRQPTDVHAGLDSTLTMLGHPIKTKHARIVRAYADGLPPVLASPGDLNQVWTNLLDNALDAIADGGRITLRTRQEGPLVFVHVEDDGPGIPAEVQARIFEPFFTTKEPGQGTGLGLDIVQRIVAQHEGRLDVTSAPGRTDFAVALPVAG